MHHYSSLLKINKVFTWNLDTVECRLHMRKRVERVVECTSSTRWGRKNNNMKMGIYASKKYKKKEKVMPIDLVKAL